MTAAARVPVIVGSPVITNRGTELVMAVTNTGVVLRDQYGDERDIDFGDILARAFGSDVVYEALAPWWQALSEDVRATVRERLGQVQHMLTGYWHAHPSMALEGEPHQIYGDPNASVKRKAQAKARELNRMLKMTPSYARILFGPKSTRTSIDFRTLERWAAAFAGEDGLDIRGLVDRRSLRGQQGFSAIDPSVRQIADEIFSQYQGDVSAVSIKTIEKQIRRRMTVQGITASVPQRLFAEYLSKRQSHIGRTTRAQRSQNHRSKGGGHSSFAAMLMGNWAIDFTRSDVFVRDPVTGEVRSVEIVTVIDVATRVILALRVVPRSGNSVDAGLALYDAMRPMSMIVRGQKVDDYRWCGLPDRIIVNGQALQGVHYKPGGRLISMSCDNGSVFVSDYFQALLRSFGVDLILNRGSRPQDNAHVERLHETYATPLQDLPGYKARNVTERGRFVDRSSEGMLTADELESYLRKWVGTVYHRSPHSRLTVPGLPHGQTPLAAWDSLYAVAGRIDVPQHPDLIFDFLPTSAHVIRHDGVTRSGLVYDAEVLDEFRMVRKGTFKPGTTKVDFHYDPRDAWNLWFRHPESGRIHEIPCRTSHVRDRPLTDWMLDQAAANIRGRAASRRDTELEVLTEIGHLHQPDQSKAVRSHMFAERLRYDAAQRDQADIDQYRRARGMLSTEPRTNPARPTNAGDGFVIDEPWPDYLGEGA